MKQNYYVGQFRDDALNGNNRGWLVGSFMPSGPRQDEDVEIKYWEFKAGEIPKDYLKSSAIVECTFILKGKVRCTIDKEVFVLQAGDYVVIRPGTPNNTVTEIIENCIGLTVKAPSDTTAKTIL